MSEDAGRHYYESARPFIVFPLHDSLEGWMDVAANLEIMINYLIEQKAQRVTVQYVDKRVDGEICDPRDYGLAVEAFRDHQSHHEFYLHLLEKKPQNDEKS